MTTEQRIEYGDEQRVELPDGTPLYLPRDADQCPDCQVDRGEYHQEGCDIEQCPTCDTQLLKCPHSIMGDGPTFDRTDLFNP